MSSQAAKKNRFASRVRAVEDFEVDPSESELLVEADYQADAIESPVRPAMAAVGTKNKTIELRLDTISTLKNAVNWQKIIGDGPQTEKDIIENALNNWFAERGYPRQA